MSIFHHAFIFVSLSDINFMLLNTQIKENNVILSNLITFIILSCKI